MPSPRTPARRCERRIRLYLLLAVMALAPMPLTAEWLLLRDGSQIETVDRWQVAKGLVTFELASRRGLFSLRASEVDLAGSEALTRRRIEEAERRAAAPSAVRPARRVPVLVLTDRDVRKVKRAPKSPAAASGGAGAAEESPSVAPSRLPSGLEIVSWRRQDVAETGGFVIEGELRNRGGSVAVGLQLEVALTVGDGSVVASRSARMSATTLAPRQRSRFRAEFPDPVSFEKVDFRLDPEAIAWVEILGFSGALEPGAQPAAAS